MSGKRSIRFFAFAAAVLFLPLLMPAVPGLGAAPAHAKPKLHEAQFFGSPQNAPTVRVRAENGRWMLMGSPGITYKFSYFVKANRRLRWIYVGGGEAPAPGYANATGSHPAPFMRGFPKDEKQYTAWGDGVFYLPNSQIGHDRNVVINACNALLAEGRTTARPAVTYAYLPLIAAVKIAKWDHEFLGLKGTATVRVICEAEPTKIEAPPKPIAIDVRIKKIREHKCPRQVNVTAIVDYDNKEAFAQFRFRHNGKLSKLIEMKPRKVKVGSKTVYRVERMKTYHLDPGEHRFKVEVRNGGKSEQRSVQVSCPPPKVTWMNLKYSYPKTHHCPQAVIEETFFKANAPGEIDYVIKSQFGVVAHSGTLTAKRNGNEYVATAKRKIMLNAVEMDMMAMWAKDPNVNSGWKKLKVECPKVLSGGFQFVDNAKPKCTREAKVVLNMTVDSSGQIPYSLLCAGGRAWHRVATAIPGNNGTHIAPDSFGLKIDRTETLQCSLVSMATGKPVVIAKRTQGFVCANPAIDTPTDLRGATAPPQTNARPNMTTPELSCRNGTPRNDKCFCAGGYDLQKLGPRRFRCVHSAPEIACKNGSVEKGACVCRQGWKRKKLSANAFKCQKLKQKIACDGGKPSKGKCVCPRGFKRKKIDAKHFKCQKPKRIAQCRGGKVKKGKCKCPRRKIPVNGVCIKPAG